MQKQLEQKKLILFDDPDEKDKNVINKYVLELKNKLKNQSMMRNMLENGNSKDNDYFIQESNL